MENNCPFCGYNGIKPGDVFCMDCANPLPSRPKPIELHGRYRIQGILGQGGMGTIYAAEDINLGQRIVAIKEVKLSGLQSQGERDKVLNAFEHEALLLAKLSHPNLPSIHEHFNDHDHWYIVMQYIRGETLSKRLRVMPDGRVPVEDVLNIGIKLCEALAYLHAQTPPVIFSDLKPDNIMLTPEGHLYLIDFGIARLFEATIADDRKFVSQGYSPPEQYQRTQLSPRADIYSLGATLHHMLSGHHSAKAEPSFAPLQLGKQLWAAELEILVITMLKQNEEERPPNIILVKQALQRIADLRIQERDVSSDFSSWSERTSVWGSPSWGITSSPTAVSWTTRTVSGDTTQRRISPSLSESSLLESLPTVLIPSDETLLTPTPSLPAFVTYRDVQLSLDTITTLAWSPDASRLAATDGKVIHIYAWPPEQQPAAKNMQVVPFRSWSLDNLLSSINNGIDEASSFQISESRKSIDYDWDDVPTLIARMKEEYLVIEWSPDATHLAIAGTILESELFVLNTTKVSPPLAFRNHKKSIWSISWSPNGKLIASGGYEHTILVQEAKNGKIKCSKIHSGSVTAIAWSPDSTYLASASSDGTIQVWKSTTGSEVCTYQGHSEHVYDILWTSDGKYIVSCGADRTVQIWDPKTARKLRSIEAHTGSVEHIAFFGQERFLASLAGNGTTCIWRTDNWALVEKFKMGYLLGLSASSTSFNLATAHWVANSPYSNIRLYNIDVAQLQRSSKVTGIQYTNAKVVLLGDSGVGKSGLGLVLSHQGFVPTESTHGRTVWTFARRENKLDDGRKEIREMLLWDLAGQPGYRLIHQLHLNEVAIALVVFDAHSETDPFAGISHWVRALRTAQRVRGNMGTMKMLLVLARMDRGGKRVGHIRIDELIQRMGFDGYFETSAKEGTNIGALAKAIEQAIEWDELPKVTSTEHFQDIKTFLVSEKQARRLLSTADDLYRAFMSTLVPLGNNKDSSVEFATGIRLLESSGLIRQLSFGNLVLLQPELLDTYASALVNAVRDEPDGLGSISEENVHAAVFPIPKSERISDPEQEKLLLIAMVKDLLFYEIALREQGEDGPYLVFPSESTRENPSLPDPENAEVVFTFEGPALNIYATLAVRLSHSGLFSKRDLWKNAVIYDARVGGKCGIWLKVIEDGKGELTLFFDEHTSEETRFHFNEYVQIHLQRKALQESIKSRYIHRCDCGFVASDQLVRLRTERGFNWFICPICGNRIYMYDLGERLRSVPSSRITEMDRAADMQRNRATAQSTLQGKQETNDFDVFLCYNEADRVAIISLGERLKEQGLLPWLDVWEMRPGLPWQRLLEQRIEQIKSAVVFVGKEGVGPWQHQQLDAFLREFVRRGCPVIPVILSDAPKEPKLPIFLQGMRWVDFREQVSTTDIDPMDQLFWGITGKRRMLQ